MPCFNCGARQNDPARGVSPWKRGVREDRQVLICPECQRRDLPLDHCSACCSVELVCRLGEVECRACGQVKEADPPDLVSSGAPGLSDEVQAALDRVLRRRP
ncbi:hypothetical protein GCM10027589_17960 [Actinocorallia lasiicapitis]